MRPRILGCQIKAGRVLANVSQGALARAAGLPRQTLARMEGSGRSRIVSRNKTTAAVLAALGSHGVLLTSRGVELAQRPADQA
jgi:hypothetical protein